MASSGMPNPETAGSVCCSAGASSGTVVCVGNDLMFGSRIRSSAEAAGCRYIAVRSLAALQAALPMASLVIVDLGSTSTDPLQAIGAALKARSCGDGKARLVAYGSHIEKDLLARAKVAGCDAVLARSEFVEELSQLIAQAVAQVIPQSSSNGCGSAPSTSERGKGGERAASKLTVLVFGALLAAIIYTAYHVMPFFYYYYELQNHFEQMIRVASTQTDSEIRQKLIYYIRRYELPVDENSLEISRSDGVMTISLRYTEVFSVEWQGKEYVLREFPFHAYAEGEF